MKRSKWTFNRRQGQATHRTALHKGLSLLLLLLLLPALSGCAAAVRQQRQQLRDARAQRAAQATATVEASEPGGTPAASADEAAGAEPAGEAISETVSSAAEPAGGSVDATGAERLIGSYVVTRELPQKCEEMAGYNARFTWVAVPWNAVEPRPGVFRWQAADQVINAAHACGLDIGVHVLSRSAWATEAPPAGSRDPSMPPKDMNQYANFVSQLASRYAGKISRYSIENEAHSLNNWPAEAEHYFELLAVAYDAIKQADPNALVENSGLSSSAVGFAMAYELLQQGQEQAATAHMQRYFAHYAPGAGGGEPIVVEEGADLEILARHPEAARVLEWMPLLFAHHQYYDVVQLHYFAPWQQIPEVMAWVENHLAEAGSASKPIEFWEFGYGWDDMASYDPAAHGREEVKYLATAIGEGALRVLSWQFTDYAAPMGHPGLVTAEGPRPAATSFKLTAGKLNGTVASARLEMGEGVWGYRFELNTGAEVYVLWSEETVGAIEVALPGVSGPVTVTRHTGETFSADAQALPLSPDPIFVEP